MQIVYAPDERAEALARGFWAAQRILISTADRGAVEAQGALLLVTTDYYTPALWQMKRWLTERSAILAGRLCACLVRSENGSGGELALRSLVSQLLAAESVVCLGAVACGDGMIRLGGHTEARAAMTPPEYHTKLLQMATKFG